MGVVFIPTYLRTRTIEPQMLSNELVMYLAFRSP